VIVVGLQHKFTIPPIVGRGVQTQFTLTPNVGHGLKIMVISVIIFNVLLDFLSRVALLYIVCLPSVVLSLDDRTCSNLKTYCIRRGFFDGESQKTAYASRKTGLFH